MKSKVFLFSGIILLVIGILLDKLTRLHVLGSVLIIIGVTLKIIYILAKVRSGEYNPGKELILLIVGLLLLFTGLYLRGNEHRLIEPVYLIGFGITLKILFILRFIQIVRSRKK